MKKNLLEKDGFYLSLFLCVCLLAVGGIWYTNRNVDQLAKDKDNEIHLIEGEDNKVPTSTNSEEDLEKAKDSSSTNTNTESKLSYLGTSVLRGYSDKEPSYSKTLDQWEIHKAIDISSEVGTDVKSLTAGTVEDVFTSDKYGVSVKIKKDGKDEYIVYSNLAKDAKVKKGDTVKQGQVIGQIGETAKAECEDGAHLHLEAYKGNELVDPSNLLK
ncbi:MAG: M23 family metallopeptidase [Clostridioides sp.]|jgi:murein DD-endopeptidase MepM/ murein hydrolase activator NlpD|nr:M23 family metallopeptidase [Clostridioides sp.]